jgi:hypothetical protein
MDTHSLPPAERIDLYEDRAGQLRRMAKAEPIARYRHQMLALAEQYQDVAASLKKQLARLHAA